MAEPKRTSGERQVANAIEGIRADHRLRYEWAAERIPVDARVLDAGCGVGYGAWLLAERGSHVVAMDISSDAVEYARRFWSRPNIEFRVRDLHEPQFMESDSFDAVVALESLEHLVEPRLFLHRVARHLGSGGSLFLSLPNARVRPHSLVDNAYHFEHYTFEEMSALLRETGFSLTACFQQDRGEITEGSNGRFHVAAARLVKPVEVDLELLLHTAFQRLTHENHKRAEAATFAQKELTATKKALKDIREKADAAGVPEVVQNYINDLRQQVEDLRKRLDDSYQRLDDSHQRSNQQTAAIHQMAAQHSELVSLVRSREEHVAILESTIERLNVQDELHRRSHLDDSSPRGTREFAGPTEQRGSGDTNAIDTLRRLQRLVDKRLRTGAGD